MKRSGLPGLKVFVAIAAHGSFRDASKALGLSVSATSQAMRSLEDGLGLKLLARTTRSVALTPAGERLLVAIEPALSAIDSAIEIVRAEEHRLSGILTLSVPRTAAELFLVPLVRDFSALYPRVTVELLVEDGFTDIVSARFDGGVRLGESLERDMIAVPLGPDLRMAVVASPAYLKLHPTPQAPGDLHHHACIRRRFAGGGLLRWEFECGSEQVDVAVEGAIIVNDDRLMIEAALGGAGLAYVLGAQAAGAVADGRLVELLQDWCPAVPGFSLYFPERRLMRPVLRAFVDFLKQSSRGNPES